MKNTKVITKTVSFALAVVLAILIFGKSGRAQETIFDRVRQLPDLGACPSSGPADPDLLKALTSAVAQAKIQAKAMSDSAAQMKDAGVAPKETLQQLSDTADKMNQALSANDPCVAARAFAKLSPNPVLGVQTSSSSAPNCDGKTPPCIFAVAEGETEVHGKVLLGNDGKLAQNTTAKLIVGGSTFDIITFDATTGDFKQSVAPLNGYNKLQVVQQDTNGKSVLQSDEVVVAGGVTCDQSSKTLPCLNQPHPGETEVSGLAATSAGKVSDGTKVDIKINGRSVGNATVAATKNDKGDFSFSLDGLDPLSPSTTVQADQTPAVSGSSNTTGPVLVHGVTPKSKISVSTDRLDFGHQSLQTASDSKPVTVTNNTGGSLSLQALTATVQPRNFQVSGCPNAIENTQQCTFNVTFSPFQVKPRERYLALVASGDAQVFEAFRVKLNEAQGKVDALEKAWQIEKRCSDEKEGKRDRDCAEKVYCPKGACFAKVSQPNGIDTCIETGSIATCTTKAKHNFGTSSHVVIANNSVTGYDGTFLVTAVPSSTEFSYRVVAKLGSGSGGTASLETEEQRNVRCVADQAKENYPEDQDCPATRKSADTLYGKWQIARDDAAKVEQQLRSQFQVVSLSAVADPWKFPFTRAVVGVDMSAASSRTVKQSYAIDFDLIAPVRIVNKNEDPLENRVWLWLNPRITSLPQAANFSTVASINETGSFFQSVSGGNISQIVNGQDVNGGLEFALIKPRDGIPWWGEYPNSQARLGVSWIFGGGVSTPFSTDSTEVQSAVTQAICDAFKAPPGQTISSSAGLICTYTGSNTSPSIVVDSKGTTKSFIDFYTPDRSRFFRRFYTGLRFKTFFFSRDVHSFCKPFETRANDEGNCNAPYDIFPGIIDLSVGQDEAVTAGKFTGLLFRTEAVYPLPWYQGIHIFGSIYTKLQRERTPGPPFSPYTIQTPAAGSANDLNTFRFPLPPLDRDYFRIGVGVDLIQVFKKTGQPSKNTPQAPATDSKPAS